MKSWETMPIFIKNNSVKPLFCILKKKHFYRFLKRVFDLLASITLLLLLILPCLMIACLICIDSKGGPLFLQERVGRYGRIFKIYKFRTMTQNSEEKGFITHKNDERVTRVGKFLRKTHIDEFPQLLNVISGEMSFVGTRPEVPKFVNMYEDEWYATLLMRPGITSTASFSFEDEAIYLVKDNADSIYRNKILPDKMRLNIEDIKKSNIWNDFKILWKTLF